MASKMDSKKKEVVIGINSFNKPAETSGMDAWTKLITRLLFMRPGSYPTDPEMGCDLGKYEFSFLDDVKNEIQELITDQVRTYLPDIPFDTVSVQSQSSDTGKPILLIILQFRFDEGQYDSSVVAVEKTQNLINFEVVI